MFSLPYLKILIDQLLSQALLCVLEYLNERDRNISPQEAFISPLHFFMKIGRELGRQRDSEIRICNNKEVLTHEEPGYHRKGYGFYFRCNGNILEVIKQQGTLV